MGVDSVVAGDYAGGAVDVKGMGCEREARYAPGVVGKVAAQASTAARASSAFCLSPAMRACISAWFFAPCRSAAASARVASLYCLVRMAATALSCFS